MTITIAVVFGTWLLCNLPQIIYIIIRGRIYGDKPPFPFWILVGDKVMTFIFRWRYAKKSLIS